jgi:hypothetical protein
MRIGWLTQISESYNPAFYLPDIFENIFPPRNTAVVVSARISEGTITNGHLENKSSAINDSCFCWLKPLFKKTA